MKGSKLAIWINTTLVITLITYSYVTSAHSKDKASFITSGLFIILMAFVNGGDWRSTQPAAQRGWIYLFSYYRHFITHWFFCLYFRQLKTTNETDL